MTQKTVPKLYIAKPNERYPRHLVIVTTSGDLDTHEIVKTKVLKGKSKPVRERAKRGVYYRLNTAYLPRVLKALPEAELSKAVEQEIEQQKVEKVPEDFSVPDFAGELYPYQRQDVWSLVNNDGWFLWLDMGLGKSIVTISALHYLKAYPALVVCPNSVKAVWADEAEKFFGDAINVCVIDGPKEQRLMQIADPDPDIKVINYESLRIYPELADQEWKALVADEHHRVANPRAQVTKAFHRIDADKKYCLSGTPTRNGRYEELWSPLFYCNPPEAPVWMGDFTFKPIKDVSVGDTVVGWTDGTYREGKSGQFERPRLVKTRVKNVHRRQSAIVRVTFASGRSIRCTPDHLWLNHKWGKYWEKHKPHQDWCRKWVQPEIGRTLCHVVDPVEPDMGNPELSAWLGGIFDGEGSFANNGLTIAQDPVVNPEVHSAIKDALEELEIPYTIQARKHDTLETFLITGGKQGFVEFFSKVRSRRAPNAEQPVLTTNFKKADEIVSVEPDGHGEVLSLQTETGNYIAWGYLSKNCFPDHWQGYWQFLHRYTIRQQQGWIAGYANTQEILNFLDSHSTRRRKEDVLKDLPPIVDVVRSVPLSKEQRQKYDLIAKHLKLELSEGKVKNIPTALAQLTRLKQACFSPELYGGEGVSTKVNEAKELAAELIEEGHKVIVFSQWSKATRIVERELKEFGTAYIDGSVPTDKRREEIRRFQNDDDCKLFIGTYGACKEGITLTAASYVILTDLPWVPADIEQACARAHRIGQKGTVHVVEIRAEDTIEDKIAKKLGYKRGMISQITDRGEREFPVRKLMKSLSDIL